MIKQYRPRMNVVARPTKAGGTGIMITGHHELMVPLLVVGSSFGAGGSELGEVRGDHPDRKDHPAPLQTFKTPDCSYAGFFPEIISWIRSAVLGEKTRMIR